MGSGIGRLIERARWRSGLITYNNIEIQEGQIWLRDGINVDGVKIGGEHWRSLE